MILIFFHIFKRNYKHRNFVETVLEKVTEFLCEYAKAFKEAGANGVVMAEPAAGLLSPTLIEEFSTPYVNKIREAVEDDSFMVMYHNCGNVVPLMGQIKDIDAQAYSFGNAIDIEKALEVIPPMTPFENIDAFFAAVDEFYSK
ncbi:MAG: uroporphyrinogen decarboxylase family protein [Oliverpabstia sp.]